MFGRGSSKKWQKSGNYNYPKNVTFVNLLKDKKLYNKGEIIISHCKGHNCIILFFDFDEFYENHRWLFHKNFFCR